MVMKQIRWFAGLSLVGGITAVPLLIAFAQTGWGAPGTAVYARYELLNRLMAIALLFMALGWLGTRQILAGYGRWAALLAFLGTLTMSAGTAAEFWLYSDLPYADNNLRQTAFMIFSSGSLLLDAGATAVGVAVWRSHIWPRWSAIMLLLAFPLDVAAFFWLNAIFLTATVLSLTIGYHLLRIHCDEAL